MFRKTISFFLFFFPKYHNALAYNIAGVDPPRPEMWNSSKKMIPHVPLCVSTLQDPSRNESEALNESVRTPTVSLDGVCEAVE